MWVVMGKRYNEEKTKYNLKECCEDCLHYCQKKKLCAMLYPTKPHERQSFLQAKTGERIYFCKMFEAQ
jgi:hypothetical protein